MAEELKSYLPSWGTEHLRLRAEWLHTCDERAVTVAYQGFHEDNIHDDLSHIVSPTLVMAAQNGDVILPDELNEIASLISTVETVRVNAAGHMIPWDNFNGFFAAVDTFLAINV
jgi:N-formylmaleamate deformylase